MKTFREFIKEAKNVENEKDWSTWKDPSPNDREKIIRRYKHLKSVKTGSAEDYQKLNKVIVRYNFLYDRLP